MLLVGTSLNDLGGTEYLKVQHGLVAGRPPALDLVRELAVHRIILAAADSGYLHSAHDCAEGGMLVALAESCLLGGIGVRCPAIRPEDGAAPRRRLLRRVGEPLHSQRPLARHARAAVPGPTAPRRAGPARRSRVASRSSSRDSSGVSLADLAQAWEGSIV